MNNALWDKNGVRFRLRQTNSGSQTYNWLFIPGGPGSDSIYLASLIDLLQLPGNSWLIDFPGNGNNIQQGKINNFDNWFNLVVPLAKHFPNPVFIGHSFGGMLPLLYPDMENILKGYVGVSTAPCLWLEEAAKLAKKRNLPPIEEPMLRFNQNPNNENFQIFLRACMPYYFSKTENIEKGFELLKDVPFNFDIVQAGLGKLIEMDFKAIWIPQKVPTLLLGGEEDSMTPFSLFENDKRFYRDNILLSKLPEAGHVTWLEKPAEVKKAFSQFLTMLQEQ